VDPARRAVGRGTRATGHFRAAVFENVGLRTGLQGDKNGNGRFLLERIRADNNGEQRIVVIVRPMPRLDGCSIQKLKRSESEMSSPQHGTNPFLSAPVSSYPFRQGSPISVLIP
jgi:hypothetical protein